MAKKQFTLPDKYTSAGYANWDIRRTIREAENVARWNPWLAHAWMEEAHNQLSLDKPFFKEFDDAVQRINDRWRIMRTFRWYNETDFWQLNGEQRSPRYLKYTTEAHDYSF